MAGQGKDNNGYGYFPIQFALLHVNKGSWPAINTLQAPSI